ncbi:hypothetical protein SAMN02745216_02316 [Desulfatibacillum alkenivorans DSM 16219]|jgi:hypothetical protein|uniref:DUF6160 domain-containing protein n=1 Tax=Desulfatibacillum alkenivorans DSM 16219 TaxID=1121393 RepID=A0A1M6MCK9_9BACT|nr:DUF6160 family protein [Desulfatibacillum alkenivorans]SHJ81127.1 hypothetical protein SAMN02745216_02316 [Desulfatibacillum alkenivorans DSM 16219]
MKKLVILAAILMLVPGMALADMGLLNESSLNDVTGQVGITIDQSLKATIGAVEWTDADGFETTTPGGGNTGALELSVITIDNGGNAISMTGLTIDADDASLVIGLPAMTGDISVGNIYLTDGSTAATTSSSLGSLTISDLNMSGSKVVVMPH